MHLASELMSSRQYLDCHIINVFLEKYERASFWAVTSHGVALGIGTNEVSYFGLMGG